MNKNKFVQGILWRLLTLLVSRVGGAITTFLLAFLLVPADFGLVAITTIYIVGFEALRDFGLKTSIIVEDFNVEEAFITILTYCIASSISLILITFFVAEMIAEYFSEPQLAAALKVLSFTLLISGISLIYQAVSQKKMDFKNNSLPEIGGRVAYMLSVIVFAFLGFGFWSLIIATIINQIVRGALYISLVPLKWVNKFNIYYFKKHVIAGKGFAFNSLLNFMAQHLDKFLVASLLNIESLGFYYLATTICKLPWQVVSQLAHHIHLPHLVGLNDNDKIKSYKSVVSIVSYVTVFLYIIIITCVPSALLSVYGDKWAQAIPIIYVLSAYYFMRTVNGRVSALIFSNKRAMHYSNCLILAMLTTCIFALSLDIKSPSDIGLCYLLGIVSAWGYMVIYLHFTKSVNVLFSLGYITRASLVAFISISSISLTGTILNSSPLYELFTNIGLFLIATTFLSWVFYKKELLLLRNKLEI